MKTAVFYKVLNDNGSARIGTGKWFLPAHGRPGKWMPKIEGGLVPCACGYHLCRPKGLVEWIGPAIYEAEYRGDWIEKDALVLVAREARLLRKVTAWNDETARLFACDCAEHVLGIFEKKFPEDTRPREAIATARRFARGKATVGERDAAKDAAWDARDAVGIAAGDAAWAAARAAGDTAWAAARAAASAASWHVAWAARDAEQKWQTTRLFQYLSGKRK